ncbi:hypothetical protein H9P43_005902 [Blastocladiella emersonii ATCC 22665]|nr:hypothetical protein H9P43_005902 [Blastocladiella emersonii ATCC 22665]
MVCGVGDLSSIARTACDAEAKGTVATIAIITNDIVPEILARNMLILNALASSVPGVETDRLASYVGQLWFSHTMQYDARAFWEDQMKDCLATDWNSRPGFAPVRTQSLETVEAVRHCWRSWLDVDWSVDTLFAKRAEFLGPDAGSSVDGDFAQLFMDKLQKPAARSIEAKAVIFASEMGAKTYGEPYAVNPTMLLIRDNGEPYYAIDATARPLAMFDDPDVHASPPETVMLATVREWTAALQRMLFPADPKLRVVSVLGHAVQLLEELHGDDTMGFDAIDVGNLGDLCGLLNVLVHASAMLNRYPYPRARSHIYAYTKRMVEAKVASQDEFVAAATGLAYEAFPALLALGLVEKPFEHDWTTWVQRSLPDPESGVVQLTFFGITAAAVPTSLADSPFLTEALDKCMAHLSNPNSLDFHFKTDALRQKLLSHSLAWGRLVFEGVKPCLAPPFYSPTSAAGRLEPGSVAEAFQMSDQIAAALLYGLPVSKALSAPDGDYLGALDIALPVPADENGNALEAVGPSHLVLEITSPQCPSPIRIESLRTKITKENPPRLRVVAFVPQRVHIEALKPGALCLYREFLPPRLGGPSPQRDRELVGCGPVPRDCILPSEIPFTPLHRCLRGLVTRVDDCRAIDPAGPRAFPVLLPIVRVVEARGTVEIVLALPPRLADAKLTLASKQLHRAQYGAAILVVNGRPQIMRLTSPVRTVKVRVARKLGRVTVVLERVMYPDIDLGPIDHAPRLSDRMVRRLRDGAVARALEAARAAAPDPRFRLSRDLIPDDDSQGYKANYTSALILELFDAFERGAQIVDVRPVNEGFPLAVFLLYGTVLVPAQGPGMAPTPGLRAAVATACATFARDGVPGLWANASLLNQFLEAQHPGARDNNRFNVILDSTAAQSTLLSDLLTDFLAARRAEVLADDPRFDARVYKRIHPLLLSVVLVPLCKLRGLAKFEVVKE